MINSYENTSNPDGYDFNEKFMNYINYEHNKIRKKLYLPYSRSPFYIIKFIAMFY
ncbi:hypothetical protein UT300007_01630 [Clostridium sp. CTA-7]